MNTSRVTLSLEAHFGWELHQFNRIKLVYMEIPLGYNSVTFCQWRKQSMQVKEGFSWTQTVSQCLVWEIYSSHVILGVMMKLKYFAGYKLLTQNKAYFIVQERDCYLREGNLSLEMYTNTYYAGLIIDKGSTSR
ncbi:hypothetical protein CR513_62330, partial [Mucuna pruriens]